MKFHATITPTGKNTTGIPVPEEVVATLGAGKRPAVKVTLGSYTYRTTVASVEGMYMLSVSAEVRQNAGVQAGDEVEVDIELDTDPRTVDVPPDLAQALAAAPDARRFFDGLSYSNQRRIVLNIESAKTEETRQRRIAKTVENLLAGKV